MARLRQSAWQAHTQPSAGTGGEDGEEAVQRAAEVACTSALLAKFHAHRDAWERMEVRGMIALPAVTAHTISANGHGSKYKLSSLSDSERSPHD